MTTELDQVKQALRITREKLAEREALCWELLRCVDGLASSAEEIDAISDKAHQQLHEDES